MWLKHVLPHRKIRNRLSQRAFRRRRDEYVKELLSRAEASQRPDTERIVALEQENSLLRRRLTEVQSRLEGLQGTLQMITDSISKTRTQILSRTIEEGSSGKSGTSEQSAGSRTTIPHAQPLELRTQPLSCPFTRLNQDNLLSAEKIVGSALVIDAVFEFPNESSLVFADESTVDHSTADLEWMMSPLKSQQIPNIWTLNYETGSQSYFNAMAYGRCSASISGSQWTQSNSPFSDHIMVLRQLLQAKLSQPRLATKNDCRS